VLAVEDQSPLSLEEDTFALAVVEYGGNLRAAFTAVFGPETKNPQAKAQIMLARPNIRARVQELLTASSDACLISLSSHLMELAEIRDVAKVQGAVKVALGAEKARGEAAGFYKTKIELPEGLDLELASNAKKLSEFVQTTMNELANKLPV
jgi:hypothetical protein